MASSPRIARPPDLVLKVKVNEVKSRRLGAGWKNDDGSVSIRLDPGVVLDWRITTEGGYITLFPRDKDD